VSLAFSLRMAWRETRGAWRHFGVFFGCVALGVAALVSVGTFARNLDHTLAREARTLTGGDLELRSARALADGERTALAELGAGAVTTGVREVVGMARDPARGATLLVELKAIEREYPLYGRVETAPAAPLDALLADRDGDAGIVVEPRLLERLGLTVGDPLIVGATRFRVAAVLVREPDRPTGLVSLGPRALVSGTALERTELLQVGSRVRYRTLVRLPAGASARAAAADLGRVLADPAVRVTAYDEAQPGLRRFLAQLATYLGLVGLASLLVGGVGIASSVTTFLRRQLGTIAILKCLGAGWRGLLVTYLAQTLAVGFLGSLAGAGLGVAAQPMLVRALAPFAPFRLDVQLDTGTIVRGLALGVLTSLLCALWPLLAIRAVPPSLIFRRDVAAGAWRPRRPWFAALPIVAGLAVLAVWQVGSLKIGSIFIGAALAALALLFGFSHGLVRLARRLPRLRGLAWRQGLAGLDRPGGHTVRVVMALGVGVMLLVAVALLEASLGHQLAYEQKRDAPTFFFIDVQPDQRDAFGRLVADVGGGGALALTPIVRARLAAIEGAPVTRALIDRRKRETPDKVWYLTREYVLTWATEPPAGTVIVGGRWWTPGEAAARPRVSVEEEAAKYFGIGVGATLAFDVQGLPVEAEVTSLRRVDWQTLTANFFMILSPGALDGAPATYMATARVPAAVETQLQDKVVAAFPNVTAIPLRGVLARVAEVLDQIAFAVRFMALFTIAAGLVVMAGALAATRYQRLYESVILKTLGATRWAIARAFAVEYACLGATAGLGGTLLAAVLAWIVLRFVLDTPWTLEPETLLLGVLLTTAGSLAIGLLATVRLIGRAPLSVLRQE
jgi:putative ABC transport system permease protein